jgi:hypothetical protein
LRRFSSVKNLCRFTAGLAADFSRLARTIVDKLAEAIQKVETSARVSWEP